MFTWPLCTVTSIPYLLGTSMYNHEGDELVPTDGEKAMPKLACVFVGRFPF